ncbi:hypothetical protein N0V94_005347 [Neodidymelliopsis sp. IMI 364377]|nr:hypothetical protein N0V94_005347 [Neodidymelliopsis sp. IMI 364377]
MRPAEPGSVFVGHKQHTSKVVAPYDRLSLECVGAECKVNMMRYFQTTIKYSTPYGSGFDGAFHKSGIKLHVNNCAVAPGVAVRIRDPVSEAVQQIDFDMGEMQNFEAVIFEPQHNYTLNNELNELLELSSQERHPTWNCFFCIKVSRKEKNVAKDLAGYSSFSDTRGPSFMPCSPKIYDISEGLKSSFDWLCSAVDIEIWVVLSDKNQLYRSIFERYYHIIEEVAHCGRYDRFAAGWFWSKHKLYATPEQFESANTSEGDSSRYFDRFVDVAKQDSSSRMFPKRPPWL